MQKSTDTLRRDVEALIQQSDKLLESVRDLMDEATRIRAEAVRLEALNWTGNAAKRHRRVRDRPKPAQNSRG
jgi:hypothetical protein